MVIVEVVIPHAIKDGLGVYRRGQRYQETARLAEEKAALGLVKVIRVAEMVNKANQQLYSKPKLVSRTGNWFMFSDGDKVLGRKAAADKLSVTMAELEVELVNLNP
jgi:hypothetical protein